MGKRFWNARRAAVLAVLLLAAAVMALAALFVLRGRAGNSRTEMVSGGAGTSALPTVSMEMCGRTMNPLHGYTENSREKAGRPDLTLLPEDRALTVEIDGSHPVSKLRYEIRNFAGDHLIERTDVSDFTAEGSVQKAVLPIQNLISAGTEYSMTIALTLTDGSEAYYYTRILQPDGIDARAMIDLAADFSDKTFDSSAARDLTTYLEVSPDADNNSLGHTTLENNFDMLTWHGTGMQKNGQTTVHLRELGSNGCVVVLDYDARLGTDSGNLDFDVTESFTMKQGPERIFMMDYSRRVNQIYTGSPSTVSGSRISLGVGDGTGTEVRTSASGKQTAFVTDGSLWLYDGSGKTLTNLFSGASQDARIRLLSCADNGDVNYVVSGYQSTGTHAGAVGTDVYHYSAGDNSQTEVLFIPSDEDSAGLMQDIGEFAYLKDDGTFFFLMNGAVYEVGTSDNTVQTVASGLTDRTFAVSGSGGRIAWQEGNDPYACTRIHVMNLDGDGADRTIDAADGDCLLLAGFVGNDVVYGVCRLEDRLMAENRVTTMPMGSVEIVGPDMETETSYHKDGIYVTGISIAGSRVHMTRLRWDGTQYVAESDDTLINNEVKDDDGSTAALTTTDRTLGEVYYVPAETSAKEITTRTVGRTQVRENHEVDVQAGAISSDLWYAEARGERVGRYSDFAEALNAVYDEMGIVTDSEGQIIWSRVDRPDTVSGSAEAASRALNYLETFKNGGRRAEDGTRLIDCRGLSLSQMLYFVGRGIPAVICEGSTVRLVTGYDPYNIDCLENAGTADARSEKIGLNDASAMIDGMGRDFICFAAVPET